MKKLRLNWIMPRAGMGGGPKSNRLIAEAMVRRGHHVNLCVITYRPPLPPPWRIRTFCKQALARWRTRNLQQHPYESKLVNVISIPRPRIEPDDVPDADVVIGTWWETMEWIKDWPASKGLKAYFIRHYETFGGETERVKATYRIPALKLVIARWLQELMAKEFGDPNAVLVPNGVDWNQFNSTPRGKQPVPTVGMMYGVVGWKGAATAFEAIRIAQRSLPQLRVVSFGINPVRREHVPPANFEFHLRPPQSKIPELYRSADCWLLPSTSEGFGMPGLEAAACRCPVVSTRSGGPEDYVRHGHSGFLVNVGDADEMARRVLEVVTLDEARWRAMSEASYAVARTFDWDRSAEILERAIVAARNAGDPAELTADTAGR